LGILPDFPQSQFTALLAQRYGYFINRDTLTGVFAHQVQTTIYRMTQRLKMNGLARRFNPAWLFIISYYRVFLRVTQGTSRLQSILADRYAAKAYNAYDLVDGILHILKQELLFEMNVPREITWARQQGQKPQNVYRVLTVRNQTQKELLELKMAEIIEMPTSSDASTPNLHERISRIEQFKPGKYAEQNSGLVSDLLLNLEELQTKMIAIIDARY